MVGNVEGRSGPVSLYEEPSLAKFLDMRCIRNMEYFFDGFLSICDRLFIK